MNGGHAHAWVKKVNIMVGHPIRDIRNSHFSYCDFFPHYVNILYLHASELAADPVCESRLLAAGFGYEYGPSWVYFLGILKLHFKCVGSLVSWQKLPASPC